MRESFSTKYMSSMHENAMQQSEELEAKNI